MSIAPSSDDSISDGVGRRPFLRRRKSCPFANSKAPKIDYKDPRLLQRYTSERGKIVPSRITAVSAKMQHKLFLICVSGAHRSIFDVISIIYLPFSMSNLSGAYWSINFHVLFDCRSGCCERGRGLGNGAPI